MEVTGKAVFLTGGAKGIGRAVCEALLRKGAKVFFCDICMTTGKATEAELQTQYGVGNVIFSQCDVADADQLTGVFKKAVDHFGAVEICVNNAGIIDELNWERVVTVNLMSYIRCCQLALQHMRRDSGGRGGVIINIVSSTGLKAIYHVPVYAATKHAIIGFTQSWATNPRMKEMGVRWSSLCPGAVVTDFTSNLKEGQMVDYEKHEAKNAKSHILPSDVANAFMMLLENEDGNGAILAVSERIGGAHYKKRQLVDSDGVSNPVLVDASVNI